MNADAVMEVRAAPRPRPITLSRRVIGRTFSLLGALHCVVGCVAASGDDSDSPIWWAIGRKRKGMGHGAWGIGMEERWRGDGIDGTGSEELEERGEEGGSP
jgi:hypothetical protein